VTLSIFAALVGKYTRRANDCTRAFIVHFATFRAFISIL